MCNYCSNTVEFRGEPTKLEKLKDLFMVLLENGRNEDKGQLPEFAQAEEGHFFELELYPFPVVVYETRWTPNIGVMLKIAEHFSLGFVYEYAEPMNGIRGEVHYIDGVFSVIRQDLN